MPTGMIINIQYYCTHLENKVRPAVCHKQPELLEHCVIFLQDNAAPHHHHNVQNLVNWWGCEVLAHHSYSQYLAACDYWLFAHVKEHLQGKRFESEVDINIAATASFHHLSKVECRAVIDHLSHRWEKCVDTDGGYIVLRAYLQCCYLVFCYYTKIMHKTSEMTCIVLLLHFPMFWL